MSPRAQNVTRAVLVALVPAFAGALLWAARAFASQEVAPIRSDLDRHLAITGAERPVMMEVVKRLERRDRQVVRALAALCKATPQATAECLTALETE